MIKIALNTILGLILIFIWSRFVNLEEIFKTISGVKIVYLIPVFFFMLLSPVIRALRLKIFLSEVKKISFKDLIFLNGVAMILNFFIPIRAGELAKGVFLSTNYKLPFGKAVIWIFLDRFVDFLAVLGVSAILIGFIPTTLPANFIKIISVISIFSLVLTYLAIFQQGFTKKIVGFLKHIFVFSKLKNYFEKTSHFILDAFTILKRHPKDLFLLILITIFAYGVDALIWYFAFISLGFYQDFLKMYFGQMLSALTYLIPAAPGYVGSEEASGSLILSGILGIGNNLASAMIVLTHVSTAIFVIIYGLVSIFNLKIDLRFILKKSFKRK